MPTQRLFLLMCIILLAACTPPAMPTVTAVLPTAIPVSPTNPPPQPTITTAPTTEGAWLSPSPRAGHAMAYNPKSNLVILYGGSCGDYKLETGYYGDTWVFDVAANTWKEMKPETSPGLLSNPNLAYDAESDRTILYGGGKFVPGEGTFADQWKEENKTWAYDYNTNTWEQMRAKGPAAFHGRYMVYDNESDRVILFGGYNIKEDKFYQDTWAYDYNRDTWTEMKPLLSPPSRNYHSMTYDLKADRIILWGGDAVTQSQPDTPRDPNIWAYDYNNNAWEERKPAPGPLGRLGGAIAYDAGADRTILYGGGWDGSSDMWAYDYNQNTWTELKPKENPGMLFQHKMVYLPILDRLFLFGGSSSSTTCHDGTWLYDYKTKTWTEVMPEP